MLEYPNANVPKDDVRAWQELPWTHPWFNKLNVAESQGLLCGPHGIYPTQFPVISRPTYNMDGMGAGAEIWRGPQDVIYRPGHFWSEVIEGDHVSWDLKVESGEIMESYAALGHKTSVSHFTHWEIWRASSPAIHCKSFIERNFHGKSGKFNLECIGDKIIEVHFRWCPEWEHWYDMVPFYSVPLWQDSDVWQELAPDRGDGWEVIPDTVPCLTSPARLGVMLCLDPNMARSHPRYSRYIY